MKHLLLCMLGLGLTACGSSPKGSDNDQDELAMLVGTYTNGSSKGIYTFRFNQETGTAVALSSAALPNPSYLVPSEDGNRVYAVSEMNDSTAALSSLSFDRKTGKLRLLNTVPTFGADPCYVATNGREVLTANYSGGTMSVFPLQKDGTLASADTLFQGSATGPDALRQGTPHIHCTVFS
ncbi:MAG: lactonase family protein, partial [Bacteroides sp.]|nr:lactonase family protein [Bacteroides sp.]